MSYKVLLPQPILPEGYAYLKEHGFEVVDGRGKVTYEPSDLRQGFKAVVKGTDDLRAENWTTVTTTTSPLHFFTVVIEND